MIPEFDADGFLPLGVWDCTGKEFLERFVGDGKRKQFSKTILNVIDYTAYNGPHLFWSVAPLLQTGQTREILIASFYSNLKNKYPIEGTA